MLLIETKTREEKWTLRGGGRDRVDPINATARGQRQWAWNQAKRGGARDWAAAQGTAVCTDEASESNRREG